MAYLQVARLGDMLGTLVHVSAALSVFAVPG